MPNSVPRLVQLPSESDGLAGTAGTSSIREPDASDARSVSASAASCHRAIQIPAPTTARTRVPVSRTTVTSALWRPDRFTRSWIGPWISCP